MYRRFQIFAVCLMTSAFSWGTSMASPRVWIADQGNNQGFNNRILEIDPLNKKEPPDPNGTDVIILRTLQSPAGAFLDELSFDDEQRLWCVVKDTSDQTSDGATRIDKETAAIQKQIFPDFPGETFGGFLEGLAWDGSGLWITAVRNGLAGNMLTRVSPDTGLPIAPFNQGTLGDFVNIPGNIAQGLLYDPSGSGFLWHSDVGINKIFKLDLARLTDGNAGNDNDLAVAEFTVPFPPKGMAWYGDLIWVASPNNGIWQFNPSNGATQKLFNTPTWNLDGIAILDGPSIQTSVASIERSVWLGDPLSPDQFTIKNGGEGTIDYTIASNQPWLEVDPTSGQSTGEEDTIEVSYKFIELGLPADDYHAEITITAAGAVNTPKVVPVTVRVQTVGPDLDGDGDVDQADFGQFQRCLSGSGVPATFGCEDAAFDGDGDVDQDDFGIFQACISGTTIPADRECVP